MFYLRKKEKKTYKVAWAHKELKIKQKRQCTFKNPIKQVSKEKWKLGCKLRRQELLLFNIE